MLYGRVVGRPERMSALGLSLALLGFTLFPASPAHAGVPKAGTVNPVQNTTYHPSPSINPITFGAKTDIEATSGDGVSDNSSTHWTIINRGLISTTGLDGVSTNSPTSLTNYGTISGSAAGVALPGGSSIVNAGGATINGGAQITGAGAITNFGTINGLVALFQGPLINNVSGVISSDGPPVIALGSDVTNSGLIYNGVADGIYLGAGGIGPGSLKNTSTGHIIADRFAVVSFLGSLALINAGEIQGTAGVDMLLGGQLVNSSGGTISGSDFAIGDLGAAPGYASTIINHAHATIQGGNRGISFDTGAGATTLSNDGLITGDDIAVEIASGSITNLLRGTISGGRAIVVSSDTATVDNNGLIEGEIFLSRGGTIINRGNGILSGDIFGKGEITVTNAGTWQVGGKQGYESSGGTITNVGTIEFAPFFLHVLEVSSRGFASLDGATVFRNGSSTATGVINLANGNVGDRLSIDSPFVGARGHSVLNLDAFLGGPRSSADQLQLDGGSSGQTLIRIYDRNPGHGAVNSDGIVLVTGATAAADFVLDPTVPAYDKKNNGIIHGLYLYSLAFQRGNEVLIGTGGPAAHQLTTSLTVGQSILSSTDFSSSGGGSGAAGFVGFTGGDFAGADRPRIWTAAVNTLAPDPMGQGRYAGRPGESQMAAAPTLRLSAVQSSAGMDTGYDQGLAMLKGGVDLIRHQDGKTSFSLGVGTAYIQSDQRFTDGGAAMFYSGVVYGGYADYRSGSAYVTASFKSAMLKARYQAPWLTGSTPTAGLTATGVQIDGGARLGLAHGWNLEPVASMAASRTSMSDLQIDGETARFNASLTGWANVGARLEGTAFLGGYRVDSRFTARVWDRFGDNSAYLAGLGPDSPLVDRISGVSGEVAAELRVSAGPNLHGFVQTSARAGMAQTSAAALAGLSLSW